MSEYWYTPTDIEADIARNALAARDVIHLTNEEIEAMAQVLDAHMFAAPVLCDKHAELMLGVTFRLIHYRLTA